MNPFDTPPFPGFTPEGLQFLRNLKENNDREWFKPRKAIYDDHLLDPARCLVADFARRAPERDLPLTGDPKRSLFRIYRDTRFSKNKAPYKTHIGLVLSRSGGRKEDGKLYVHIEPGASFVAGGFWRLDPKPLRAVRTRIADAPGAWLDAVAQAEAAGLTVSAGDPLTRMPRGFEDHAESDVAEWIRARFLSARRSVTDDALLDPAFTETVLDIAAGALPVLEFGWEAMGE